MQPATSARASVLPPRSQMTCRSFAVQGGQESDGKVENVSEARMCASDVEPVNGRSCTAAEVAAPFTAIQW